MVAYLFSTETDMLAFARHPLAIMIDGTFRTNDMHLIMLILVFMDAGTNIVNIAWVLQRACRGPPHRAPQRAAVRFWGGALLTRLWTGATLRMPPQLRMKNALDRHRAPAPA